MTERSSLFDLLKRSLKRKGKVDELPATDPGDGAYQLSMAQFSETIPDQINVVGNASSLLNTAYGPAIDRYPTIRFNKAQLEQTDAQGTRWDFVATSDRKTLEYYSEHAPPFHTLLFTPYYDRHLEYLDAKLFGTPHLVYPMRLSIELMEKLRARPTTGAQILWLLHRLERRNVHIFGFDWKRTPTFYDRDHTKEPHNHFGEMMLFRRLINRNGWTLHQ
ncbi:glycosyltransferase family 29 protein [Qingshengfaniella alkalisoli]|uniref:Uncharacterized protein n=1 Tax=Qingshengfaniella alkalisoli TaxID=2599296 RepID=A0A5B8IS03_9RHOB|nr:glycosyltransferase family 29 protein [Qingshengfaniella alkalisoli]QDY68364.1 hypothetical protein FPZ52_01160 [Qingshengfaniella alkalisoli]